jgi:hypothetical protein
MRRGAIEEKGLASVALSRIDAVQTQTRQITCAIEPVSHDRAASSEALIVVSLSSISTLDTQGQQWESVKSHPGNLAQRKRGNL